LVHPRNIRSMLELRTQKKIFCALITGFTASPRWCEDPRPGTGSGATTPCFQGSNARLTTPVSGSPERWVTGTT
jgi:hypothetical protein